MPPREQVSNWKGQQTASCLPGPVTDEERREAMIDKLLAVYENGSITADHLVVECLHMIDPAKPGVVLAVLPDDVLQRVLKYARDYRPGKMRSDYGFEPASDQVAAARKWIEAKARQSA
jgi:hypothetical protein